MSQTPDNRPSVQDLAKAIEAFAEERKGEIELRNKEVELKDKELDIELEKAKMAHQFSLNSLAANERHSAELRKQQAAQLKWGFLFFSGIICVFAGSILLALYWNKDLIIMEIIKAVILIIGGGSAGYALGKKSQKSEKFQQ